MISTLQISPQCAFISRYLVTALNNGYSSEMFSYFYYYYLFQLQMGFYPVAVVLQ
jgi:hypothetical protein